MTKKKDMFVSARVTGIRTVSGPTAESIAAEKAKTPEADYDTGTPAYLAPVSALMLACPDCQAPPFEPCRRDPINIDDPELSGHVTVCGGRIQEPPAILIGDSDPEGEAMPCPPPIVGSRLMRGPLSAGVDAAC